MNYNFIGLDLTQNPTVGFTDFNFSWGIEDAEANEITRGEAFIRIASALLSPVSFLFEFLLLDQPLSIFNLLHLPSYAGYQYSFIALLELLTCPADKILTYRDYYEQTVLLKKDNRNLAECNTIYYILSPIFGLLEKVIKDPVPAILDLIPNLMFFISVGGMNDLLNNFVHFIYVLLDMLKPIINVYDLIGSLLSNIDIGGAKFNLSLPLNIDFNSVLSSLMTNVLGSALVLGKTTIKDEEGNVIKEEDITLKLPYIDFYTLCAGKLVNFNSKEMRRTIRMDDNGGGDLMTALLRIVVSVLYVEDNLDVVVALVMSMSENLDDYDKETMELLLAELGTMIPDFNTADIVLLVMYYVLTTVSGLSTTLADLLVENGLSIMDLIAVLSLGDVGAIIEFISGLAGGSPVVPDEDNDGIPDKDMQSGGGITTGTAISSIFDKIKAFFDRLVLFIKRSLGFA